MSQFKTHILPEYLAVALNTLVGISILYGVSMRVANSKRNKPENEENALIGFSLLWPVSVPYLFCYVVADNLTRASWAVTDYAICMFHYLKQRKLT
jgi:hypothetical protein